MHTDRRTLLQAAAALPLAAAGTNVAFAQAPAAAPAASPPKEVTRALAHYLVTASYDDLPANVRKEGVRTLLNWVGVAIGGSHHETVDIAVSALGPFSGPQQASLFGRRERFDIMNAAFINGVSSHIFDYDDTHLKTIIHPAGPVASAILALSELQPVSGKEFLNALVLGVETECRIGNSVYPNHYDVGWHITGTAGVFGSAAAAGKLLKLSEQQMTWALGLAASQPVGLRESFGSMNKSFNPGRAASSGVFAAILASKNFTSSDAMIEAKRGWANTISTKQDYNEILGDLGKRYEAALNTYKPFACGIVMHPAIDAAIQLRNESKLTADQIERVDLKVHPLVLELTGKKTPKQGLEGKFSIYHAVAVAIVEGAGGEKQFSDRAVTDPTVVALRAKVNPVITPGIKPEQVDLTIVLKDGRKLNRYIEHAIGSVEVPMTDKQLETKFSDLADGVIPAAAIRRVMDACWNVENLPSAAEIAKMSVAV
ncbi:MmgE/PrpD family protein [Bradyrhizobium arachidis]|uniref:MmgE/PrpD family protein n=1 Tax=Bradyrhizobium arachidis TaxID=858423 RepID=A0AAE7NTF2_9BRAD|nr:MmgE/PrpD family protein [Bradyrhizobium arachidis]QOZ71623.1 MmgE/PrpD family protein [Bradyrhizobium arachidis]SFU54682.1 2-methylcitrate dehydratase PrpD [Bradyrhizobium arachidis]